MPCRVGLPRLGRFGDTIRRVGMGQLHRWDAPATPWSVDWLAFCTRVQVGTARDALRYHAVGVRGRPWSRSDWVADGRDASAIPSVWVGVYPEIWVGHFALVKCYTCLRGCIRCSAVDVRTTVGLNRLGEVRVQTWMFGVVPRAHKRLRVIVCFFRQSHHTACSTTPMQGKTTEWFTCMGGAARCLMRRRVLG